MFPVPGAVPGQRRPSINAHGRKGRVDGRQRAAQRLALGAHGSTLESTHPRPQAPLLCQEMGAPSKHPGETPQGTGRRRVCPPLFNSTLLSLKLMHHLFCSKIQRLCLLCPKSPPRRPTSPPESAQRPLRQPTSPGPPEQLSLPDSCPFSSLAWPWSEPSEPPPLFRGQAQWLILCFRSLHGSFNVQTLREGLGGHAPSGPSRLITSPPSPPSWYSGVQFPTRDRLAMAAWPQNMSLLEPGSSFLLSIPPKKSPTPGSLPFLMLPP